VTGPRRWKDLRLLTYADGEALLAVNRACPIHADFSFLFERGPDFFAWPDAVFDAYAYMGGFREGRLVAYVLFALAGGQVEGGDVFSYSGDARVMPGERGDAFVRAAAREAIEALAPTGAGLAIVKRGNLAAARTVAGLALPGLEVTRLGEFRVVSLLLLGRHRPSRHHRVRRAVPGDAASLADLARRAYRGRPFAPVVDVDALLRDAERLPGFGIDRYYLAFDGDRPVGALGAWDADAVHRAVVLRYTWRARALRAAHGAARLLLRQAAPLPAPGQHFRAITITRVAVPGEDPSVLHDLLAAVHADHLGRGYHLIHIGFTAGDPLEAATRGFLRHTFASDLLLTATPRAAAAIRAGGRPYLDLRFV
jgi:hypothetical protein